MDKFLKKNPMLNKRIKKTFILFKENIHHPSLRLHELQGEYKGIHSISINMTYRMSLILKITKDEVIPLNIGTHDEVY